MICSRPKSSVPFSHIHSVTSGRSAAQLGKRDEAAVGLGERPCRNDATAAACWAVIP